jgi:hypothetical protein
MEYGLFEPRRVLRGFAQRRVSLDELRAVRRGVLVRWVLDVCMRPR